MYKYLDKVNSPQDIKSMTVDEVDLLAKDITVTNASVDFKILC